MGARYIVGLEREMRFLSVNEEQYLEKIIGFIRNSELTEPLRSQVLAQSDYVDYRGMSVLRIRVPTQKQISFVGEKAFIRENSSTIEATGKKLLAVNSLFV